MLVNEYIKEFRKRSFFIESELICNMLVVFFEASSSGWISLSINEGVSRVSLEDSEPFLLDISDIDDDFAYPVEVADELSDYVGKEIVGIYEYRIENIETGCIGFYFDCGDVGFSLLEDDGCLSIYNGICNNFKKSVCLFKKERFS
ncbi:hypothetical protein [Dickeya zeae]|uniref:hypothetical protein n=1 Tax=Dickeya zeae TaxID=204042 RepID=UPI001CF23BD5|nr:hypothetical protein [Dickeya zeae]MCA6987173.1 hypothetical protein [Dickeya zeae]